MIISRINILSLATGTSFSGVIPNGRMGWAETIKVKIPQMAGTPTATINIYDIDGDLVFSKAALAENAVTMITSRAENKDIPIVPGATINLTFTTAPGVETSTITLYIKER